MKLTANAKPNLRSLFPGLVPLFILAHFGHHLLTALPVPLLPMIRSDFSLDYAQSGLVVSAFSLSYGIGQLPAGWLGDRLGARITLTLGILGVAVAGLLVGLSHTYIMMIVFMALMGLLGGGYHPGSAKIISTAVETKRRGWTLGVHMIGGSASFFLAPIIAAAIAAVWGWRGSFIGLAIPTLIFGIAFYIILKRSNYVEHYEANTTSTHIETPPKNGYLRRLIPVMVLVGATQSILHATLAFVPVYFVDHFGISKETAAASIAFVYSSGLWASPLGGHLSDRWGRIPVLLVACLGAVPAIYLLNLAPYGVGTAALLIAIGMIIYIYSPVTQAYIIETSPERYRSTVLGIYFFSSMEGAGILMPILGYLIDRLGFLYSFTIAAGVLLIVAVVCSMLIRGNRRRLSSETP